jgi:hypothetical protein
MVLPSARRSRGLPGCRDIEAMIHLSARRNRRLWLIDEGERESRPLKEDAVPPLVECSSEMVTPRGVGLEGCAREAEAGLRAST